MSQSNLWLDPGSYRNWSSESACPSVSLSAAGFRWIFASILLTRPGHNSFSYLFRRLASSDSKRYLLLWIISKLLISGLFPRYEVTKQPTLLRIPYFSKFLGECLFLIFTYEVTAIPCIQKAYSFSFLVGHSISMTSSSLPKRKPAVSIFVPSVWYSVTEMIFEFESITT